ncbi:alpha/beta hydrolase [Pelistega indica]|uniref:Alpha/beta hydrolase n=1 Tax=Pelistega indica TaxID=1414851 RepID=V8G2M8_9BURK|nr:MULTISPECIES: alpha/beta hydrolase [Pelistega]ETD70779.1 alpha/beta hydrolase [Pelistega indica]
MRTETIFFDGKAGSIECAIDWPDADTPIKGWALCLHPHPLFDGTNTNKVVTTLARACVAHGLVAFRPNFRGVGKSEGQFDKAHGETLDMLTMVQQIQQKYPDIFIQPWVLGGFSFGSAVAAQLHAEIEDAGLLLPTQLILLGTGVWRFSYRDTKLPSNALLVHGEKDDVIPLTDTYRWLENKEVPITIIPAAGHFFHGKLVMLKNIIQEKLRLAI